MFDGAQLLGFLAAVTALVLLPGPNTLLIVAHSVGRGRTAGLATVMGVEAGTLLHTTAAALGLSAFLSASPLAFGLVTYAGAGYLMALGVRALQGTGPSPGGSTRSSLDSSRAFRRALVTNLLNPKAAVFFVAFLPQFVRPERGRIALQVAALGAILSAVGLVYGSLLALAAGTAGAWLRRPALAVWQGRLTAAVFLGLGLWLVLARG